MVIVMHSQAVETQKLRARGLVRAPITSHQVKLSLPSNDTLPNILKFCGYFMWCVQ